MASQKKLKSFTHHYQLAKCHFALFGKALLPLGHSLAASSYRPISAMNVMTERDYGTAVAS
ncbi:uncharacterized protein PHALS_14836 [Plasmopara halstedii]|uniref:Uncharacterized protein n=1 Tax=Plasmopara halstedii TaxID=4781 RepID=A0A0P1AX27_PLAHL|nr:uncharacterized protein PHALS_14836 [Plasmopara halstedii]CEG45745.1 hypothetical protein PHALS_14836 [Plasmopara halstedii]|eukprot:XP_024582114.1 hypothetical protein PHALS_14836 [Plasmopara halstedii]